MGSRSKKRRRADGSVADGRVKPFTNPAPLVIDWEERPLGPVPPETLQLALTISIKHHPIDAVELAAFERSSDFALNDAEMAASREIRLKIGDDDLWRDVEGRAWLLERFLGKTGQRHYHVSDDGIVQVREDLLAYAASTPLTSHLDEVLTWSPGS